MKIARYGMIVTAALVACGHNAQNAEPQTATQSQYGAPYGSCPMAQLRGVQVAVAEARDGVALAFTAPQEEIEVVRAAVRSMAEANDKQGDAFAPCPCAMTAQYGATESMPGSAMPARPMPMVPADARADDTPTGAVLQLTAKDKRQVETLRSVTAERARALLSACIGEAAR
jgi:hypothetical protein